MSYVTKAVDRLGTPHYRLYFTHQGVLISPFHDIPLWADNGIANMIVEIPKGENAKMEISSSTPMNPIKQDVKKGKLRYVHWPYPCNYGAFPQTWENPLVVDHRTNAKGDNDPLDVCDISDVPHKSGDVVPVKILGTYAMIDEGETDWKVVVIDASDPHAAEINDIGDVERVFPGRLIELFSFLKYYKTPAAGAPNVFAFDGQVQNRDFALVIIEEQHDHWRRLISGETPQKTQRYDMACLYTQLEGPNRVSPGEAENHIIVSYLNYVRGSL
jgi:inorganic pyrophosphatase